jgi:hypothetical protein
MRLQDEKRRLVNEEEAMWLKVKAKRGKLVGK